MWRHETMESGTALSACTGPHRPLPYLQEPLELRDNVPWGTLFLASKHIRKVFDDVPIGSFYVKSSSLLHRQLVYSAVQVKVVAGQVGQSESEPSNPSRASRTPLKTRAGDGRHRCCNRRCEGWQSPRHQRRPGCFLTASSMLVSGCSIPCIARVVMVVYY